MTLLGTGTLCSATNPGQSEAGDRIITPTDTARYLTSCYCQSFMSFWQCLQENGNTEGRCQRYREAPGKLRKALQDLCKYEPPLAGIVHLGGKKSMRM